jgi:ERCC4-type nuclease
MEIINEHSNMEGSEIMVYADKREQNLLSTIRDVFAQIPLFGNAPELEEKTLDTGDYIITRRFAGGDEMVLAVIERKTLSDYGASLKDHRICNLEKMLKLRAETGCHIYYLIEGKLNPGQNSLHSGIEYYKILASIRDTQIRHGVMVLQTVGIAHTCEEIRFLAERYGMPANLQDNVRILGGLSEAMNKIKPTQEQTDNKQILIIWANLISKSEKINTLGISTLKATELARVFTLGQWIRGEISEQAASDLRINGRKLDTRIAEMLALPMTRDLQCKMLSCINRVSEQMAREISRQTDLRTASAESLRNLVVRPGSKNSKLGPTLAAKIMGLMISCAHNQLC